MILDSPTFDLYSELVRFVNGFTLRLNLPVYMLHIPRPALLSRLYLAFAALPLPFLPRRRILHVHIFLAPAGSPTPPG